MEQSTTSFDIFLHLFRFRVSYYEFHESDHLFKYQQSDCQA